VDAADDVRPGEHQQVVVALEIMRVIGEARAAVIGFLQPVALDHRAHGAVEDEQALLEQGREFGRTIGLHESPRQNNKTPGTPQ
jgi:hypothetical protein